MGNPAIGLTEMEESFGDSVMVQFVRVYVMRKGIFIHVASTDRQRLEAIVRDPNSAQKDVWQAWFFVDGKRSWPRKLRTRARSPSA